MSDSSAQGITKRLIEIMKTKVMKKSTCSLLLAALETLLRYSASADIFRSLALYVTYAVSDDARAIKASKDYLPENVECCLTPREMGIQTLSVLSRFLCNQGRSADVNRFSRSVTTKVRAKETSLRVPCTDISSSGFCTYSPRMTTKW